jgi:hypothetical protein
MPYQSFNNAILINSCQPLGNLNVQLEVTEDISTVEGNGFSFQVNCYPPPGVYVQYEQLNFLQYNIYVVNNQLYWQVQYYSQGSSSFPPGYTPTPSTTPWLPCWPNDYGSGGPGGLYGTSAPAFGPANLLPGNTLLRGSNLQVALQNDDNENVSTVVFNYWDPDGIHYATYFDIPKNALCPIVAFTVNLVGPGGCSNCTFTTGLTNSRGIFYYTVDYPGTLSDQGGPAGSACGEQFYTTCETSNAAYSPVIGAPASTVTQTLGPAVPCAVESLFADESPRGGPAQRAVIGQMRNVRDEQLGAPAGAFLSEVLARHSADLVGVLADHPTLSAESRKLLREAARVAQEGARFDDELIDRGERLVRRVEVLLPRSMSGIPDATRTILASLRGRTLADGIAKASETILPRFPDNPDPLPPPKGPGSCCGA